MIAYILVSCKREHNNIQVVLPANQIQEKSAPRHYDATQIVDILKVFNNVYVFYNNSMTNMSGRYLSKDGYNLGLKWQSVEFVKHYYVSCLNHEMPVSYGHAKDFFNRTLNDNHKKQS
ncbi:hypothetical protein [Gelidibacter mesophilus]|uniref:hypothetical protein n=1 Tax=Gelidibacter mesophilus TaxID=169050 RepID=UPI0004021900|nr:hypothetical protein [Gelidibacter mesophilus]